MPGPICTIMQNFTPIGVTVAEISVTVQKLTSNLISDKPHTKVGLEDNKVEAQLRATESDVASRLYRSKNRIERIALTDLHQPRKRTRADRSERCDDVLEQLYWLTVAGEIKLSYPVRSRSIICYNPLQISFASHAGAMPPNLAENTNPAIMCCCSPRLLFSDTRSAVCDETNFTNAYMTRVYDSSDG